MITLTALLVAAMFVRVRRVLLGVGAVVAAAAIFFVIRTGHLGAKLAWGGPPGGGRPPAGFNRQGLSGQGPRGAGFNRQGAPGQGSGGG